MRNAFIVSGLTFLVDQWAEVIRHSPFVIAFALAHLQIGSLAHCIRHSSFAIRHCICLGSFTNWLIGTLHSSFVIRHSSLHLPWLID